MTRNFAQIEPTSTCNLHCSFCIGREFTQGHLDPNHLVTLLSLFPTLSNIHLQGEGEPFLHPDWPTLIEICRRKSRCISTTSNGTTLTDKNIELLIDSNLDLLKLSLETVNPDSFESIRGFSWTKWLYNLELLVSRVKERQSSLSIGFMVTLLKSTYLHVPAIKELYQELSLSGGMEFQWLNQSNFFTDFYRRTTPSLFLEIPTLSDSIAWMRIKSKLNLPVPRVKSFYQKIFSIPSATCPWLDTGIFMDRKGRLSPCCMIKPEQFSFGTVQSVTTEEINKEYQKLNYLFTHNIQESPCVGCSFAKAKLKIM